MLSRPAFCLVRGDPAPVCRVRAGCRSADACLRCGKLARAGGSGCPPAVLPEPTPAVGRAPGGRAGPALCLHSWGCPKQNYTFNASSSEINW